MNDSEQGLTRKGTTTRHAGMDARKHSENTSASYVQVHMQGPAILHLVDTVDKQLDTVARLLAIMSLMGEFMDSSVQGIKDSVANLKAIIVQDQQNDQAIVDKLNEQNQQLKDAIANGASPAQLTEIADAIADATSQIATVTDPTVVPDAPADPVDTTGGDTGTSTDQAAARRR